MSEHDVVLFSRNEQRLNALTDALANVLSVTLCRNPDELRDAMCEDGPGGLIAEFTGLDNGGHAEDRFLEQLREDFPQLPVVILVDEDCPEPIQRRAACANMGMLLSHCESAEVALELLNRLNASDELSTTTDENTSVENAVPNGGPSKCVDDSQAVLEGITRNFETKTAHLAKMLSDLEVAAKHDVTILLIGETGSGKTYLSKLIHEVSPRSKEPFLNVACGALPADLIESELFGHVKGAFTSAHADKEGKFLAAGRGTVLLDEIDVLGPEQQVKLLRVIETGEFEPVGSNRTIKSQARLVVASNLDLQPLVEQGRFRPDLYYRLNMLKFQLPSLRDRKPDITSLARKCIDKLTKQHGIKISRIEESLFQALLNYPWPGNVRELENVIQRAVIYSRDGVLSARELPTHILTGQAGPANDPSVDLVDDLVPETAQSHLGRQIATTEREIIEQALFSNNFSRTKTAQNLGISRVTLYNKMKKYGMK